MLPLDYEVVHVCPLIYLRGFLKLTSQRRNIMLTNSKLVSEKILETRFSKKAITCAIVLSLGVSAFPISSFAATINGVKFIDDNPKNGIKDAGEQAFTGGGDIYLKSTTAPATQIPLAAYTSSSGTYSFNIPSAGSYKIWQYVNPTSPVYSLMNGTSPQYFISEATAKIITITSSTDIVSSVNFGVPSILPSDAGYINGAKTLVNTFCSNTSAANVVSISGNPAIWPGNLTSNSIVVIKPNAVVNVPRYAPNTPNLPIHVQAVCNYGTLRSDSSNGLEIKYDTVFANFTSGTILGKNATTMSSKHGGSININPNYDSGFKQCGDVPNFDNGYGVSSACVSYFGLFLNEGTIQAGDGLDLSLLDTRVITSSITNTPNILSQYVGGTGGLIDISGNKGLVQNGIVQGGIGGNVNFTNSYYNSTTSGWSAVALGGDGGKVAINSSYMLTGNATSKTIAGQGGDVSVTNACVDRLGSCHNYELSGGSSGELIVGAGGAGGVGIIIPKGTYKGNSIWVDPTVSFVGSDTTLIADKDITIYGGDNWLLELKNLRPESIMAGRKIILATGAGGTIDLRGNNAKIFKAGDRVEIYTDNLLLDAGVTLESLVDAPNGVIRSGARIIYHATITGSSQFTAKVGETINAQLDLRNAGPKVDTYLLKATTQDGVTMNGLPTSAIVDGLKALPLNLSLAVPANMSTESTTITITATSQADPTVIATFEVRLNVPQITCAEPATYDTSTRLVNLPKIDIPLLSPIDGKESGEIAVFSGQLEQVQGVDDFKIKPNSLQFLNFSKAYNPSHARYSFNTGLFSNGGALKTCVSVPSVIIIPPNTPIYTTPKHYLVTLRQLAVSADTFHVESITNANP